MTLRRRRTVLALAMCVGVVAIATPLAQRSYRQSYSGNVRYDGKFVFIRLSYPWYGGRGAPWVIQTRTSIRVQPSPCGTPLRFVLQLHARPHGPPHRISAR